MMLCERCKSTAATTVRLQLRSRTLRGC